MSTVINEAEHESKEGELEAQRTLGALENEVEHQGESLGEHEEHITDAGEDIRWLKTETQRLNELILALPQLPMETIEELQHGMRALEERAERLESTRSLTELPNSKEIERPKLDEQPKRRNLLDRLI